jgi:hypothetical protein
VLTHPFITQYVVQPPPVAPVRARLSERREGPVEVDEYKAQPGLEDEVSAASLLGSARAKAPHADGSPQHSGEEISVRNREIRETNLLIEWD